MVNMQIPQLFHAIDDMCQTQFLILISIVSLLVRGLIYDYSPFASSIIVWYFMSPFSHTSVVMGLSGHLQGKVNITVFMTGFFYQE